MTVKHTTSYTDEAYAHAQGLAETGEYGSISAAVSAVLVRDRQRLDRERAAFEAELERRLALPDHQWLPVSAEGFLDDAIARLDARITGAVDRVDG